MELGNTKLNIENRQFLVDGTPIPLNRKEFDILNYFMLNKSRLVTKNALAEHVWGDNSDQADNFDFVYYQIKNLRKRLLESKSGLEIDSVYGVGYKLIVK